MDVKKALTMKGSIVTSAVLCAVKKIENRSAAYKDGWYAMHTGRSKPDAGLDEKVKAMCDTDEEWAYVKECEKRCPEGHIAGLFRIAHALPPESCQESKWCSGPVCLIVAETLFLEKPLPAKGALGTWSLSDDQVAILQEQVPRCEIKCSGAELQFPRDDTALAKQRKLKRVRNELADASENPKMSAASIELMKQYLAGEAQIAKAAKAANAANVAKAEAEAQVEESTR